MRFGITNNTDQTGGELLDSLLHPCQTVWAVSPFPDGDIITGGSDGRVRIWTREPGRMAREEKQTVGRICRFGVQYLMEY